MATQALINPALLRWARSRAGLSLEDAAQGASVKLAQLVSWEAGESRPTFRQAQNLAQALHTPFGYLFLDSPPQETLPLPDLRTVAGKPARPPSLNLLDTVRIALQRQAWYLEYRQDHEMEPLPFVGRFDTNAAVESVAADIRRVLDVDIETGQRTWDVYFRDLVRAAERVGILIMRSGIVGNNTHRKLDVGEFRGFAVSDTQAPIVFINSADAPAARLFTLLHELAHVWIGSSGVSQVSPGDGRREEVFCNAVAGEFLAPEQAFRARWQTAPEGLDSRIAELAARFHVSRFVVIRRALDLRLIDRATYNERYLAMLAEFRDQENAGGSFYRNAEFKNSTRFAQAVVTEALSGRLLLRDAGRLLGIQPDKIRRFAEQIGS